MKSLLNLILFAILLALSKASESDSCSELTEEDNNNFLELLTTTTQLDGAQHFNFSKNIYGEFLKVIGYKVSTIQSLLSINLTISKDLETVIKQVQVNLQAMENGLEILKKVCSDDVKMSLEFEKFKARVNLQLSDLKLNALKIHFKNRRIGNSFSVFNEIKSDFSTKKIIDNVYDKDAKNVENLIKMIEKFPQVADKIEAYFYLFINMAANDHLATYRSILMLRYLERITLKNEIFNFNHAIDLAVMKNVLKSNLKNIYCNFEDKYFHVGEKLECSTMNVSEEDSVEIETILEAKYDKNTSKTLEVIDYALNIYGSNYMVKYGCVGYKYLLDNLILKPNDKNIWKILAKLDSFDSKYFCQYNFQENVKLAIPEIVWSIYKNRGKYCIENNNQYLAYSRNKLTVLEYEPRNQVEYFEWAIRIDDEGLFCLETESSNYNSGLMCHLNKFVLEPNANGTLFKIKQTRNGRYLNAFELKFDDNDYHNHNPSERFEIYEEGNSSELWNIHKCI